MATLGVDDGWIAALHAGTDENDESALHRQLYLCEATVPSLSGSLFDDLTSEYMQWMAELNETRYDVYGVN